MNDDNDKRNNNDEEEEGYLEDDFEYYNLDEILGNRDQEGVEDGNEELEINNDSDSDDDNYNDNMYTAGEKYNDREEKSSYDSEMGNRVKDFIKKKMDNSSSKFKTPNSKGSDSFSTLGEKKDKKKERRYK